MMTIVYVALGVIVGLLVFLLLAFWLIKMKLKSWGSTLSDSLGELAQLAQTMGTSNSTPFRLSLNQPSDFTWHNAPAVTEQIEALLAAGFVSAGRFSASQQPQLRLEGFAHTEHRLYAVVYELPTTDPIVDLVGDYPDETHLTYSNIPETHLDRPEWSNKHLLESASAEQLLEALLANQPEGERVHVSAEEFAEAFESAYAREMDWRAQRGGYTREEVARVSRASDPNLGDDTIEQVYVMTQAEFVRSVDEELRRQFLQSGQISASDWDHLQDRAVFIHDLLEATTVAQHLDSALTVYTEDNEDELEVGYDERIETWTDAIESQGNREGFKAAVSATDRVAFLGSFDQPIPVDVYSLPEDDD